MRIRTQKQNHIVTVSRDGQEWPFTVSPMDPAEEEALRKKHTTYSRKSGQLLPDVDFIAIKVERAQKEIIEWPCVDENDQPVPCTKENIKTAWLLNSDLFNEVLAKSSEIAAGKIELQDEEKKI